MLGKERGWVIRDRGQRIRMTQCEMDVLPMLALFAVIGMPVDVMILL
jgi:hypothetical protein